MKPASATLALVVAAVLTGCGQGSTPPPAAGATAVELKSPAGQYKSDPNHSTLEFRVSHLGLADYVLRFTKFEAVLDLKANLASSSVTLTVDPTSVRTDYSGDYRAAHEGTPYHSFEEALAQDPKFLNAGQFPTISFRSSKVEQTAPGRLRVTGELTLLGQTHPVTLDATLTGSVAAHPFHQRGALGFTATGALKRSEFGMTHLLTPMVLVGDEVTLRFDGEFHQPAPPAV